jgi:hypothetical protein
MIGGKIPMEWQDLTDELRKVFSEGEEALRTHRAGLPRVVRIGRAFSEMQQEAMRRSHSNNPIGKRFNEAWAALVHPTPEMTKVNKTDRAQFMWCYQNRELLETWWLTLAENQRDRWGHPDTIKKQYLKAHGDDRKKQGTASSGGGVRSELAKVEELDAAINKIRRLEKDREDTPLVTRTDTVEDLARALLEWLPASKRHPVASRMLNAKVNRTYFATARINPGDDQADTAHP